MDNEKLFNENINFAYYVACKYDNYFSEKEDIKQIALIGLWEATKVYDKSRGVKFTTFAYPVIRNSINIYLRSIRKHLENDISLYTEVSENFTYNDILEDSENLIEEVESNITTQKVLSKVRNSKSKYVIEEAVIKDRKIQEIADEMKLTKQRISNLKFQGLEQLRKELVL